MRRKSTTLHVTAPRCRFCGRFWLPAEGVLASQSYCESCSSERQASALMMFGGRVETATDDSGAYLLPRHLRRN